MNKQLLLRVPLVDSIRWYSEGEHCTDPHPGDMLLVDHATETDRAIGVGEWLVAHSTQRELKPYTWCRHTALIGYDGLVSEMGPHGHEVRSLLDYQAQLYAVVRFHVTAQQIRTTLDFDHCCSSVGYGWLQFLPITIDGLTGARFMGGWGSTMICSTHVAMCMMGLGLFPERQPGAVLPAHLASYVNAVPIGGPHG